MATPDFSLMSSWEELKDHLDRATHAERVAWVYALPIKQMPALYERSAGRPIDLTHFVPASVPEGTQVVHWGKNGIPLIKAFNRFQKRFTRTASSASEQTLIGYNESSMRAFVGPGSMVCHIDTDPEGVVHPVVDYTRRVTEQVEGWPEPKPAEDRLGVLVYKSLQDWMWPVSEHVSIGRCFQHGKWSNQYFAITREDPT